MEKRAPALILTILAILAIALAAQPLIQTASAAEDYRYYIAGAYSTPESKAYLDVLNPGDETANIDVSIYYEKNDSGRFQLKVEPQMTVRVDLAQKVKGNFGLELASDQPVVVDSVVYDAAYSGGFGSLAALKPEFVWYFGEGYSSGMVKTYLLLLNPNNRESNVGVTLYYENGEKRTFNLNIPAYKHASIDLKEKTMPEKRFGMKVTGTAPIVAATANFNKKFSAGSGGIGTSILSKSWYFPDGYTSTDATEFINIINPSFGVAHLKFTMYYDDGTTASFDDTVPANSKKMFLLNNYVADMRWFSTAVESDISIVAENTHYDESYSAGHGGIGATAASTDSYFAYANVNDDTLSQLAVFNPSAKEAALDVTFYYADGTVKQLKESVPSMMRSTIDLNKRALPNKPFGLYVSSEEPVFIKLIQYDKKQSAGYAYNGMPLTVKEEEQQPESGDEEEQAPAAELQYLLVEESKVAASKMKDTIGKGLVQALKYTYSYGDTDLLAWHFSYTDEKSASNALRSALAGDLFSLMEVTPATIRGLSAHYFVAQKSEGYMWLTGKELFIFVGPIGNSSATLGLAELFTAGTPPQSGSGVGIGTILLAIGGLIALILIVRWLFRRGRDEDEDDAAWAGMIPSARPKTKRKQHKAEPGKAAKHHKPEHTAKQDKREHHRPQAKEPLPDTKKEKKKQEKHKPEQKETKHEQAHDTKPAHEYRKPAPHKVNDISIKEIPRDKLTAQDLLDEDIPDYEDVFRHVNRDQEEIKPK